VVEINYIIFILFFIPIAPYLIVRVPALKKYLISKNNARKMVKFEEIKINKSFEKLTIFEIEISNEGKSEQNIIIFSPKIKNLDGTQRTLSDGFIFNDKANERNVIDNLNSVGFGYEVNLSKGLNKCVFIYETPYVDFKKPFLLKTHLRFNQINFLEKILFESNNYESCFSLNIEKMFKK